MQSKSVTQVLLLSAIWGVSFLLIRLAGESFPPFWIALLRSSLGALLLWAALIFSGQELPKPRYILTLILVALFNNAIPFTCFAWGERFVPSSTAAILNATTPIFAMLIGSVVDRRSPRARIFAGVLLGFFGVLLVVFGQADNPAAAVSRSTFLTGCLLVTAGALGYAIAAIIAKRSLQGMAPLGIAASQLGLSALLVSPFAIFGPQPAHLRAHSLIAIIFLGFVGSGLAYLLFFHVLRTLPATHTVAVTYLLPIWGLFWGSMAHELIGFTAWAGVAVVIAGLILMNLPSKPTVPAESQLRQA